MVGGISEVFLRQSLGWTGRRLAVQSQEPQAGSPLKEDGQASSGATLDRVSLKQPKDNWETPPLAPPCPVTLLLHCCYEMPVTPELGWLGHGENMNGTAAPSPQPGEEKPTMRYFPGARDNLVGGRENPIRHARLGAVW